MVNFTIDQIRALVSLLLTLKASLLYRSLYPSPTTNENAYKGTARIPLVQHFACVGESVYLRVCVCVVRESILHHLQTPLPPFFFAAICKIFSHSSARIQWAL